MRTTTGCNIRIIRNTSIELGLLVPEGNITEIDTYQFNNRHHFSDIPPGEEYRISILHDLLSIRAQYAYFEDDNFTREDIDEMIYSICTS